MIRSERMTDMVTVLTPAPYSLCSSLMAAPAGEEKPDALSAMADDIHDKAADLDVEMARKIRIQGGVERDLRAKTEKLDELENWASCAAKKEKLLIGVHKSSPYVGLAGGVLLASLAGTMPAIALIGGAVMLGAIVADRLSVNMKKNLVRKFQSVKTEHEGVYRDYKTLSGSKRELENEISKMESDFYGLKHRERELRDAHTKAVDDTEAMEKALAHEKPENTLLVNDESDYIIVGGIKLEKRK
jgi:hypothetical protein